MKLLASLTSPYARKIRIILAEKALPFELVVDSPWEANTRVPEVNPLGKVPVLITDGGETFFDSPVIAGYLETLGVEPVLLPADGLDAVRVRQTEALADGVTDAAVAALLESRRPDGERSAREIARQRDSPPPGPGPPHPPPPPRHWFNGSAIRLGDIAAAVALAYLDLRFPDLDWRGRHPGLVPFADRMFERESFAGTRPPAG